MNTHLNYKSFVAVFGMTLLCTLLFIPIEDISAATNQESNSGQQTYLRACASCHKGGFGRFFTGAPKTGKKSVWKPLLEKGTDALVISTREGIGKMEPRGGCADCSDLEIRAAVEYMIERVR